MRCPQEASGFGRAALAGGVREKDSRSVQSAASGRLAPLNCSGMDASSRASQRRCSRSGGSPPGSSCYASGPSSSNAGRPQRGGPGSVRSSEGFRRRSWPTPGRLQRGRHNFPGLRRFHRFPWSRPPGTPQTREISPQPGITRTRRQAPGSCGPPAAGRAVPAPACGATAVTGPAIAPLIPRVPGQAPGRRTGRPWPAAFMPPLVEGLGAVVDGEHVEDQVLAFCARPGPRLRHSGAFR